MQIDTIHLTLQRPATAEEIENYQYFKELFDVMSPEERAANKIHRVVDLAAPDEPAANVVYYGTRREPAYNEVYIEPVEIPVGKSGANVAIKRKLAAMIAKYRRPEHQTFHSVGELSHNGVYIGFKNLTARAEFPVRGL